MTTEKLRIVQWATGTVGRAAMRAVLDHPHMELVGAKVYSAAKEGQDIGELCGRSRLGIPATRALADVIALKPDCVVYMPESTDMDDVVAMLAAGINIVSTRNEFFNPETMETAVRTRVEAACAQGGSTIHSSGSSPGFITEALPIVLFSLARRLDLLAIDEFANCIDGCSEEMLLDLMGFGETPEVFSKRDIAGRDEVFEYSMKVVASAIGMEIDHFEKSNEFALCKSPTKLHRTTIAAGTVAGQRSVLRGMHKGKPLMQFRSNWFVTTDLDADWDLRDDGWRVLVKGDTPLDLSISFPIPPEDRIATLPNLTGHRPVNAIPYVCAAAPGVATTAALPQVIAWLG